jgi:hypothetical protein
MRCPINRKLGYATLGEWRNVHRVDAVATTRSLWDGLNPQDQMETRLGRWRSYEDELLGAKVRKDG